MKLQWMVQRSGTVQDMQHEEELNLHRSHEVSISFSSASDWERWGECLALKTKDSFMACSPSRTLDQTLLDFSKWYPETEILLKTVKFLCRPHYRHKHKSGGQLKIFQCGMFKDMITLQSCIPAPKDVLPGDILVFIFSSGPTNNILSRKKWAIVHQTIRITDNVAVHQCVHYRPVYALQYVLQSLWA